MSRLFKEDDISTFETKWDILYSQGIKYILNPDVKPSDEIITKDNYLMLYK